MNRRHLMGILGALALSLMVIAPASAVAVDAKCDKDKKACADKKGCDGKDKKDKAGK